MIPEGNPDFRVRLIERIAHAHRIAVVGVGDELSPVDRLGMVAAREIGKLHHPGVRVFFAGTVPESITGLIRRYKPDHVVFIDSADMGALPGSVMVIGPEDTRAALVASHVLPLSVIMDFIRSDTGAGVTLLGIQPDMTRTGRAMAPSDRLRLSANLSELLETFREI